jgi:RimJ/RimL family protein N-acetyltransferase
MLPSDIAEIQTARLGIRLVQRADLAALFEVNSDDEVTRYLPYATWKDPADAGAWYDRAVARHESGDGRQFVIALRETGQVIGACLLFRYDRNSARAETGYVLGRPYWGAGLALEAMKSLIGYAFQTLDLRRLEADIDPRNHASARLLDRLGFTREGLLRERWTVKGEPSDSAFYGLLRKEWRGDAQPP